MDLKATVKVWHPCDPRVLQCVPVPQESGLSYFNTAIGEISLLCEFEHGLNTRPNDGRYVHPFSSTHLFNSLRATCLWNRGLKCGYRTLLATRRAVVDTSSETL